MFTDIFLKKPVYAYVLSIFILVLGFIGFEKLSVRQYPKLDSSVITVTTAYPGASAKDIEVFVTKPLEDSLALVDKIDYMTSDSTIGQSRITINFKLGADVNKALSDTYTSVAAAKDNLPKDIREPVIQKIDPNKSPLIYIGLLSNSKWQHARLAEYFDQSVKPSMQNLEGVGMINVFGDYDYGMHMQLDPVKLAGLGMPQSSLMQAVSRESYYPAISQLEASKRNYPLSIVGQADSSSQFNNVIIKSINNQHVNMAQVANTEMRPPQSKVQANVNGKPAVFLGIIPTNDANPVALSERVNSLIANIKSSFPSGFSMQVFWDSAVFIKQSIAEVNWAIFETTVAVLLILFLFLGSIRLTLVPAITIPISLIGTFVLMYAMGFSINTFTLLAMVLAIGMVVDDAIVVLENIFRHVEEGMPAHEAAVTGAREICHPVIVMTLTLAAVFAPIGFIDGLTGTLFREFAFTLAGSVIISGIIALTLSPLMCEKVLKQNLQESRLTQLVTGIFEKLTNCYSNALRKFIPRKKLVVFLMFVMSLLSIAGLIFMPKALVPQEDSGVLLSMISGPPGAKIDYMAPYVADFDSKAKELSGASETAIINGFMGENTAMSIAILKPWSKRGKSADVLAQDLQASSSKIPGIKAYVLNPFSVPGSSKDMPLGFVVKTFGSLQDLDKNMQKLINSIQDKNSPYYEWRIFFPNTKFHLDIPTYELELDNSRMQDLGVTNQQLGEALALALTDREGGSYSIDNERRNWYLEYADKFKENFSALSSASLILAGGKSVPISSFFKIKSAVEPSKISHFQQIRSATFAAAALMPGYTMGQALDHIKKAAESIFPQGTMFDYTSQSRTLIETQGHTAELFIFSLIFIYLVMAVQYESFKDPFIILLCVPLAGLGALVLLFLNSGSINMYTNIGMVTLIGLISKHGILLVDFANKQLLSGCSVELAIMNSAKVRLRPIVLTTVAMILAAIPLVFADGAGSVARKQMGLTILGGMTLGTILSLFFIPTIYRHYKTLRG